VIAAEPVLIAGAGPAGLAAALFLVQRGVPVTVLEAEPALPEDMRASTFHPPTLDMFHESGIAARLVAQGHEAQRWQYHRTDTGDSVVFDLSVLADLTQYPFRLQCEQFRLTQEIVAYLAGNDLFQIRFGAAVEGVEHDAAGVTVHVVQEGCATTYRGSYLIGADGAKSRVRKLIGQELTGETYPRTSITLVVDFPFEQHIPGLLNVNYVWTADDHYSLMRVRDHWRTGYSPRADQTIEEAMEDAEMQRHLQRVLPTGARYNVVHSGAYTVHRRVADNFRVGRVILAGDAAHLNSPSGGMGMNSGVHDAHELVTCLADVLDGADPSLLDLYALRRRTIAIDEVQVRSDKNHKRHREKDPARREEIWADLKNVVGDRDRMREFLIGSSMIGSLQRAAGIN
jgi:2-polyprenyl-6-methoxyphenol hydroxylase-like FAD-dependent oxidoreductase